MTADFSLVVDLELCPIPLGLFPHQVQIPIGETVVLGILICHLAHPMVPISLGYILLVTRCLEFLFHRIMVPLLRNHMLFQLVELFNDLLELFLVFLNLETVVLGLDGAVPGSAGTPIGSHLLHQQGSQQPIGNLGSTFNFPPLENLNSQPSVGGPLSQPGFVSNMTVQGRNQTFQDGFSTGAMSQDFLGDDFKSQGSHVPFNVADFSSQASQGGYAVDYVTQGAQGGFPGSFVNHNSQAGYSRFGTGNDFMSQDYVAHGSQGLFTQVVFNDPSQDGASQSHFGMANANPLHSQNLINPLYSQPFAHYNTQPLNLQATQQGQNSQNQKLHYNG